MSSTPLPPRDRRGWTLPVVFGALAAVGLVLIACVAGGITVYLVSRDEPAPAAEPTRQPSPSPSLSTPPPDAKSPASCLLGDWKETSYVGTAEIYGTRVQLTGDGSLVRFDAGTVVTVYDNKVVSGTANGDTFEVIHHGTVALNYRVDGNTLRYSNARIEGTTTWKIDGQVRDREPMQVLLEPENFACDGNELRIYGPDYASELRRVLPPGAPA